MNTSARRRSAALKPAAVHRLLDFLIRPILFSILISLHSSHKYRSPSWEYPSVPSLMIFPHREHFVASYAGGFASFSKLYSLVPYHTYISISKDCLHSGQSLQWPGWPSLGWEGQRGYR